MALSGDAGTSANKTLLFLGFHDELAVILELCTDIPPAAAWRSSIFILTLTLTLNPIPIPGEHRQSTSTECTGGASFAERKPCTWGRDISDLPQWHATLFKILYYILYYTVLWVTVRSQSPAQTQKTVATMLMKVALPSSKFFVHPSTVPRSIISFIV